MKSRGDNMNQKLEKITKYTKMVGNWMVTGNSTETTYRTSLLNQAYSKNSISKMDSLAKNMDVMDKASSESKAESKNESNTMNSKYMPKRMNQKVDTNTIDFTELTQKNLQEAIIWSEILGKPMCKRRERR
jgi:DNA anti-recombination protein RmuC